MNRIALIIFVVLALLPIAAAAQLQPGADSLSRPVSVPPVGSDTLRILSPDTSRADTSRRDTLHSADKVGIDTLVNYSGDEIDFDVQKRVSVLTGHAEITYKDMRLDAHRIEVDWDKQILTASGVRDTAWADTGRTIVDSVFWKGRPHFTQANEDFFGDEIAYNMKTRIGRVRGGNTSFDEGYYSGKQLKRISDNVITAVEGDFTTCDLNPPHYHFHSKTLKVMIGKRVVARPVELYFDDVPVLAAPFGVFPQQHGRSSGILIPTFGESGSQGRSLRDIGYYWAMNDYMDLRASVDYYEILGLLGRANFRYAKRYNVLSGSEDFDFNTQHQGGSGNRRDFRFGATHHQQIDRTTALNIAGSYVSSKAYNQSVGTIQDILNQSIQSNATLNRTWENLPWSMSANLGYTQNLNNNTWSATLPAVVFTHNSGLLFPPPKIPRNVRAATVPREVTPPWYRTFAWTYNVTYRDELSFPHLPRQEGLRPGLIDLSGHQQASTPIFGNDSSVVIQHDGLVHNASLSANAKLLKWFNLRPSISGSMLNTRNAVRYDVSGKVLDLNYDRGAFERTTFSLGTSLNTKLYGTLQKPFGLGASFRHVMTPSAGFSYRPDFSDRQWGYYKTVILPDGRKVVYDRFPAQENIGSAGGTPVGKSEAFSFSVDNLYQMKTGDSTDEKSEKRFDLLDWSLGTGVDLRRDSLKWSDLNMGFRSAIPGRIIGPLENVSVDLNTTHSLYRSVGTRRLAQFSWERPGAKWYAPIELTSASYDVTLNLRPDNIGALFGVRPSEEAIAQHDTAAVSDSLMLPQGSASLPDVARQARQSHFESRIPSFAGQGPSELFQMPLTMAISLHETHDFVNRQVTSNMTTNATFSLTPVWNVTMAYSMDLKTKAVSNVSINVTRDLHCWDASFQWSPLGVRPGYYLRIGIKSPQLRDVKIERTRGASLGGYYGGY